MKKTDWIEYFEALNGRSPEQHEVDEALSKGEFEQETVSETTSSEVEEQVVESTVNASSQVVNQDAMNQNAASQQVNQQVPPTQTGQQTVPLQQVNPQMLQQAPAAPSAAGLFFKQFKEWMISAWKNPTSIASQTHKYNGLTSLLLIAFFASLTIYLPMVKIAGGVNNVTSDLTSSFNNLFSYPTNGYNPFTVQTPTVSVGIDVLFKTFIGFALLIFSIILAGFVVKRFIYKDEKFTFAYSLEYYGRIFAINNLLYAIAALSALLGVYSLVGLATSLALFALTSASVYAIANFKNNSNLDPLYRYLIAIVVNGLIIFIAVIIAMSIVGQMFWSGLF
ncbi:DUF6574 domain-containing protein [Streptococcus suis]|uniref:DUF6574 domain-containing protein n=1 Tax=Streptococcus suis TaxID=1307 RepID=UPI001ABDC5C5|nr:hypothetical protein [Streptococcus suis]